MKLENVSFVSTADVEGFHEEALLTGGSAGVLNPSMLMSAVETPKATFDGRPLYGSLAEMAAAYAWGIARNHPFVDGNKRTAFLTALTFLELNGRAIRVGPEWVELMVRVASEAAFPRPDLVAAFIHAMGSNEPVV